MSTFRLPSDSQRIWQLAHRDYDTKPWIIYDFKGDELIADIEGAYDLALTDPIPEKPGLYIVHPTHSDDDAVEDQMWRILDAQNVGVFIDEGYMIGKNNKGFRTILTQGRSKHVPTITLTQRPVWMDRFVFSEADFFQIFQLNHKQDIKSVNDFIPHNISQRLPDYHSYFYDVPRDVIAIMKPVPDRDAILDTFAAKLARIPKVL